MVKKLHKTEQRLLKRIMKNEKLPIDSLSQNEQLSAQRLLERRLINSTDVKVDNLSGVSYIHPTKYSITPEGKRYFKDLREDMWEEKKIHILYPTVVNIIWGIIGFFIGWFLRSSFH